MAEETVITDAAEQDVPAPEDEREARGLRALVERFVRLPVGTLFLGALALSLVLTLIVEFMAAAHYQVSVKVVTGSQLGINPLGDSLDFGDIPAGAGQTRFVTLENESGRPSYIYVLSTGGACDLIDVDRSSLVLQPGESVQIAFKLSVPRSALPETYRGDVRIFRLPYVDL